MLRALLLVCITSDGFAASCDGEQCSAEDASSMLQMRTAGAAREKCKGAGGECDDWKTCSDLTCDEDSEKIEGKESCGTSHCTADDCCTLRTCSHVVCGPGDKGTYFEKIPGKETCESKKTPVGCTPEDCCQLKELCPLPPRLNETKACHFWGEPHFTHLFTQGYIKSKNKIAHVKYRGGRQVHSLRNKGKIEFHSTGVYPLASQAGDFEAQAFFCAGPAVTAGKRRIPHTSSGNGIAVKMGDQVVTMQRSPGTKGTRKSKDDKQWADFGNKDDIVKFYVNGNETSWSNFGPTPYKLGSDKHITQMHHLGGQDKKRNKGPVCLGDDKQSWLIEFAVPYFNPSAVSWPVVYETSVSVFAGNPDSEGICGNKNLQSKSISGKSVEKYQVKKDELLFNDAQMKDLCDSCGMRMVKGVCKGISAGILTKTKQWCEYKDYDQDEALKACKGEPTSWKEICIFEQCATKGNAVEWIEEEELFEAYLSQQP